MSEGKDMMQFDTIRDIRDCAECHTPPIMSLHSGKLAFYCDTCDAESRAHARADAAINEWNEQMYLDSGEADSDYERDREWA